MRVRSGGNANNACVTQMHGMGCAVACVASRSGLSYGEALALFENSSFAWERGFYCAEVVTALKRAGFHYAYEEFVAKKHTELLERPGTIVFIDACAGYPAGHYLLRTSSGWMNSWSNYPVIAPAESAIQPELPGIVGFVLYESTTA